MKAISTVIATLLILVITIALVGFSSSYIFGIFTAKTSNVFSIVDSYGDTITIKNDGTDVINEIRATIGGNPVTISLPQPIQAGQIGTIEILDQLPLGTSSIKLCTQGICNTAVVTLTSVPPPSPDFSISHNPSSQTTTQGNSVSYTITLTSLNGFSGTVTLSQTGCPTGATCSFNPASVALSSDNTATSTFTVTTTTSTPANTYSITVTGTSGALSHSTSPSLTVTVPPDTTPPSVSVSGAPPSWQNTDATASVSCTDSNSGCNSATYKLKIYDSSVSSCSTSDADYTLTSPQTITSQKWVCATAKDNANNIGFSSPVEFKIDKTNPTGTVNINNDAASTTSTSVTLTLSCSDPLSGCSQMQFSNDGVTYSTAEAFATTKSWTLTSGDGTKTVYTKFKDNANNWMTTPVTDTITLFTPCWATGTTCNSNCIFSATLSLRHYSATCTRTCRPSQTFYQLSGACSNDGTGNCFDGGAVSSQAICTNKLMYPSDSTCSKEGGSCVEGVDYTKGTNCIIYNNVVSSVSRCYWKTTP